MKKIIIILLLLIASFWGNYASATSDVEVLVLAIENNSLKTIIGSNDSDKLAIYDLYLTGNCNLTDFSIGDLLNVSASLPDKVTPGDKITHKASLTQLDLTNVETTPLDNCQIMAAISNNNDNYEVYGITQLKDKTFLFSDMQNDNYLVDVSTSCLNAGLATEQILIIKKYFPDKLSSLDNVEFILKLTADNNLGLLPIFGCQLASVTKASQTSMQINLLDQPNAKLTVFDETLDMDLNLTVDAQCQVFSAGSFDPEQFYSGSLYYQANTQNILANPLYLEYSGYTNDFSSYTKFYCQILKSTVLTDYRGSADSQLYWPPAIYWQDLPIENFYLRGASETKIYTDRPEQWFLIGHLVKGETDPATYTVDSNGNLRWIKNESVAKRLYGQDWNSQINWFSDAIIYTYKFGESIDQ